MGNLFRRSFTYGSVLAAFSMLIYGSYLILANTPSQTKYEIQFAPPQNPDTAKEILVGDTSASLSRAYIGGIGIVEPAGEAISIGSQLSGVISKVLVRPGDSIKQGEPLFVLDERTAKANVEVARIQLAAEEAKLRELKGQIAPQEARVEAANARLSLAEANLTYASRELKRAEGLSASNALSVEELDQRRLSVALAQAQTNEASAILREAKATLQLLSGEGSAPTIDVQLAAVETARAKLSREETQLALHTISAPIDCQVLQVKVRLGEFVPASVLATPLVTLGVVNPLHVRVDIDEADIPRFSSQAKAFASIRGQASNRSTMKFVRVEPYVTPKKSLTGSVSERVDTRVMQIIYAIDPAELNAIPGQQVDVYIEAK